jgi:hypothetical protein
MSSHTGKLKKIKHETESFTPKQAKRHLRHHKGTKLLNKQIKAANR